MNSTSTRTTKSHSSDENEKKQLERFSLLMFGRNVRQVILLLFFIFFPMLSRSVWRSTISRCVQSTYIRRTKNFNYGKKCGMKFRKVYNSTKMNQWGRERSQLEENEKRILWNWASKAWDLHHSRHFAEVQEMYGKSLKTHLFNVNRLFTFQ